MGRLLKRLLEGSRAYSVRRETDGFTLIGDADHIDEFSDVVREASDHAGDDFIVFTTSDGGVGYSQMFIMPMDEVTPTSR
ncbi:hypothetical protein N0B44_34150 [Roseibacterium beibuensis]|uniref:hypothetical protein n=1 Tax=[Roseibacterium] beibuensis TaxID=1193142 RepID=UPI00217D8D36|nr:hypothetical protein [Roseibacterium beibuensis]MCS6627948.1 hypothetical protein [Roseibacterium beibuensis]